MVGRLRSERRSFAAVSGRRAHRGRQASKALACGASHTWKSRLSHPPWGRIFLVFRSKNGPQAVRLCRGVSVQGGAVCGKSLYVLSPTKPLQLDCRAGSNVSRTLQLCCGERRLSPARRASRRELIRLWPPGRAALNRISWLAGDTRFRQIFEFMYHQTAREPRPC